MLFGFFFGFDFLAELFVFGVFGFAAFAFAFVVDFFDLDRFVFALILGFEVICFFFVVFLGDEGRPHCGHRQSSRVSRGGRGEQHQRGEQQDQKEREFPHAPCIGAGRGAP
jgi:hypothetical protein